MSINDLLQVVAVASGLIGSWLVVQQRVDAFYWWLASNAALIVVQWASGNHLLIALYVTYSILNLYAIRKWRADARARQTMPTEVPGAGV